MNKPDSCQTNGQLFVVATPIGNLGDISHRAVQTLASVDCILAEDTRHSRRLLQHYGINTQLRACHEHNEESLVESIKQRLDDGQQLALISDAGTPLISDPGFVLVRSLRAAGYSVLSVPGASAIIAALSVAGLPTDRFVYDGFLPAKHNARCAALNQYLTESRTIVLLESSHRIAACLNDIVIVLGPDRPLVVARELTKRFETVLSGSSSELAKLVSEDDDQTRGEFVLVLSGVEQVREADQELDSLLSVLLAELPLKQASKIAARISGKRKNQVYDRALQMKSGVVT